MKKRYTTTKNMGLIHDKILLDFPQLKGDINTGPEGGFRDSKINVEGDGTYIEVVVPDTFNITGIDNIIQNFIPIPRPRPQKTIREIVQEIADERGIDLV